MGGGDPLDADLLDIDHTPVNYTADLTPPHTDAQHLSAHIAGLDNEIALIDGINTLGQTHYPNLLTGTTPTLFTDLEMGGNDITSGGGNTVLELDAFVAGRPHMRVRDLGTTSCGFGVNGSAGGNADFFVNGEGTGRMVAPGNWVGNALLASERKSIRAVTLSSGYAVVHNETNGSRNLTDEGRVLICGGTAGVGNPVTLPDVTSPTRDGWTVTVVNITAAATVRIAPNGATTDTIIGAAQLDLTTQYEWATLVYDSANTNWLRMSRRNPARKWRSMPAGGSGTTRLRERRTSICVSLACAAATMPCDGLGQGA